MEFNITALSVKRSLASGNLLIYKPLKSQKTTTTGPNGSQSAQIFGTRNIKKKILKHEQRGSNRTNLLPNSKRSFIMKQ